MEKVVCHQALTNEEYLSTIIDHVKPAFFTDKNLAFIFDIVCSFWEKRRVIPTTTEIKSYLITDEQKDQYRSAIAAITGIDSGINKEELYENTERFLKERGIYETMMSVAKEVGIGNIDTGMILDKFEKTCSVSLVHDIGLDFFPQFNRIKKEIMEVAPVLPTGYKWLDEKLGGGMLKDGKSMYIFAAETNMGKSIVAGNIAANVALQGKNVLIITLEMSEMVYAKRLTSCISRVPIGKLTQEIDIVEAKIDNIKDIHSGARIIIKEFPPSTMTARSIESYVKKLVKKGTKIDLIVIDYLNLLTSTRGKDSYERIKHICEECRAMTYVFNCPLISPTQLNRSGYSIAEPDLTSMSESYAMGATADFVASLWQGDGDKEMGLLRMSILKNRFGINSGTNPFRIDYTTLSVFEDRDLANMTSAADESSKVLKNFSI